jgi:hypothetical protein
MQASLDEFRRLMAAVVGQREVDDARVYWPYAYALRNKDAPPGHGCLGTWWETLDNVASSFMFDEWDPERPFDDVYESAIIDLSNAYEVRHFFADWGDWTYENTLLATAQIWLEHSAMGQQQFLALNQPWHLVQTPVRKLTPPDRGTLFDCARAFGCPPPSDDTT